MTPRRDWPHLPAETQGLIVQHCDTPILSTSLVSRVWFNFVPSRRAYFERVPFRFRAQQDLSKFGKPLRSAPNI
jgi:hypothetical protein